MRKEFRGPLTETMFYILMALQSGPVCGIEIAERIEKRTRGRIRMGPGTLYTILSKFAEDKWIREIQVTGRKRTYGITQLGTTVYLEEVQRLRQCLEDAQEEQE